MARTKNKDAQDFEILKRQMSALELRASGYSFRAIGEKLGISHEQARKDVDGELKSLSDANEDKRAEMRQLDLIRLDKITKSLDHWVEAGSPQAVMAYLKAMERRAKLLGLDAPVKQEIEANVTTTLSWKDIVEQARQVAKEKSE